MPTREEMRSLAEDIVGSYADRVAGIGELRETVKLDLLESRRHIEEFRDSRIAIGKQMRADLVRDSSNRKHEVGSMLKELNSAHAAMSKELKADLAKGVANNKHEVGIILEGFSQAHSTMSKEMRANLAKSLADCKRSTGAMLKSFSTELKEVRSELAGGRDEWQILSAIMQEKRGGPMLKVEPPAEEAVEITPEIGDIRDQAFEYLANHPDGTRLVEMEQEFGLARIKIARVLRNLIDENKVEKRDMLYFAI